MEFRLEPGGVVANGKTRLKPNTFQISTEVAFLAYCRISKFDIDQGATSDGIQDTRNCTGTEIL